VNPSQEGVRRSEQAHLLPQTVACFSTKSEGDHGQDFCEAKGSMSVRGRNGGEPLSKDFALALWIQAEKTSGPQDQLHGITHQREVSQDANVPRMDFL
jgi:hypothetical protein